MCRIDATPQGGGSTRQDDAAFLSGVLAGYEDHLNQLVEGAIGLKEPAIKRLQANRIARLLDLIVSLRERLRSLEFDA